MQRLTIILALVIAFCSVAQADVTKKSPVYRALYQLEIDKGEAHASLSISSNAGALRELSFTYKPERFSDFTASAGLELSDNRVIWSIPKNGGTLRWKATVTNQRSKGAYDARLGKDGALFRAEDVFPAMASRSVKGASAITELKIRLPKGWSVVTPYTLEDGRYRIDNPVRRFDRPSGWIIAGDLGVRIDTVAGTKVKVAAAIDQNVRRQDILALSNWVLPELRRLLPDFPRSISIVSADDPFWRGGLSGPGSLYIHADRPLISENGTSTLVHELFHVGFGRRAAQGDDWIVEGLAEYYSFELLHRSGTTTRSRTQKTLNQLTKWAQKAGSLRVAASTGALTAKAAVLFSTLDTEIREASKDGKSLDDVVRKLRADSVPLTLERLQAIAAEYIGKDSRTLRKVR